MFLTPAALLEHMLQAEAQHYAFFRTFPHLRYLQDIYDHSTAPLKFLLLSLTKEPKPTTAAEAP